MDNNEIKKLDMKSMDVVDINIEKIKDLFPNVVCEGKIDFDALKQELSKELIDNKKEKYQLTWVGKKESIINSNKAINKTLRPIKDKSQNFEKTKNIYIEGDNLDALKVIQESYLNRIKCIYIDPPYNTGNDFIYNDKFEDDNYLINAGEKDEFNNRLISNLSIRGKFHSDWLSMMYSRLRVSRNLLKDDGAIFISIGQGEIDNLIKLCNELFGENNCVGIISRLMKSGGNKGQFFSPNIEYILVYAKDIGKLKPFREKISDEIADKSYKLTETQGERKGERFAIKGLCQPGLGIRPNQRYWVKCPDGSFAIPKGVTFPSKLEDGEKILPTSEDTCWRWSDIRYKEELAKGNIYFQKNNSSTALINEKGEISKWNVFTKIWLEDRKEEGRVPVDFISKWENRISSQELKDLDIPFDFAKPTELIMYLIEIMNLENDDIVLDFFSGSATTAHAVIKHNSKSINKYRWILIQMQEECPKNSDALKKGYKTICEIGEERIRRAAKKIKEETNADIDYGFRVYRVDSSNMKDIYYEPSKLNQAQLNILESNIKEDRTEEDLLTQVILDLGLTLDLSIEEKNILNNKVYFVAENSLVACFDNQINIDILNQICEEKPLKIVFRESSFRDDSDKINAYERIKKLSPETEINVI